MVHFKNLHWLVAPFYEKMVLPTVSRREKAWHPSAFELYATLLFLNYEDATTKKLVRDTDYENSNVSTMVICLLLASAAFFTQLHASNSILAV